MPLTTHFDPVAHSYAQALIDLAKQRGEAESVGAELAALKEAVDGNPLVKTFLANPAIGRDERAGVVDRALRAQASPLVSNFLGVMLGHGRIGMLDQVAGAYQALLDEHLGKVDVEVTVAQELTPDHLEEVRQRVGDALRKTAVVRQRVDDAIIGGMVLRVGDKLIDASVRSQLAAMKRRLLAAAPR